MFVGIEISVKQAQATPKHTEQPKPLITPKSPKSPKRQKSLLRSAIFDAQRAANSLVASESELQVINVVQV